MKTYALYGLILAVASVLVTLLAYFAGAQTERIGIANYFYGLGTLASFVVVFLGLQDERTSRPDQRMSFGGALGGATVISVVGAILISAYTYVHFTRINPDFAQYLGNYMQEKMTAAGLPDNVIEQAVSGVQKTSPVKQAVNACIGTIIFGFILGLLLAPTQTQRGSITRIAVVNAIVCGFFGLLMGAFNGFLSKSVGSSALIGLLTVGGGAAVTTVVLLKSTGYAPRPADEKAT